MARKQFAGWPASVKWRAYASHLGFGTGDGFFEMPSELARDKEAHRLAQSFGFYTAETGFKAALCVLPKLVGLGKASVALREVGYPIAPVFRVNIDRDQSVSLQWLERMGQRACIHYQRLSQITDCGWLASADLGEDGSLGCFQADLHTVVQGKVAIAGEAS